MRVLCINDETVHAPVTDEERAEFVVCIEDPEAELRVLEGQSRHSAISKLIHEVSQAAFSLRGGWEQLLERRIVAQTKAKLIRAAMELAQARAASRLEAMEEHFAARLLGRRGSTRERLLAWETSFTRFVKMICGNLMEALQLGPTPSSNTFQLAGVPCRTSKTANARLSRTPFR